LQVIIQETKTIALLEKHQEEHETLN